MPYIKNYLDDDGKIYSDSLIGFAWKNTKKYVLERIKEFFDTPMVGFIYWVYIPSPFVVFPFYLITSPIFYKTNSKNFDPDKDLEGNLK
ncbi:MAG: hypothetical protein ISS82_03310 [Nanoarchaeota archaeon]|nr:hypothetical protein [Nanoarchaeota archaeon]